MPAYVPNYEHDVFVSYAHVDDERLPGAEDGWVHTFVSALKTLLKQNLGRPDNFSIWIDRQKLRGNHSVTPEIRDQLHNSATILIFLSNGYLASKWCLDELELFVKRSGANSGRIFVIELTNIEPPEDVRDLRRYQFWYQDKDEKERRYARPKPDPGEKEYYTKAEDVARELAELLIELKNTIDKPSVQVIEQPRLGPAFLAEVPHSLRSRRDEVRRYLKQQGVDILPEMALSPSEQGFHTRLEEDLEKSKLFIQLLNEDDGWGFPWSQFDRARTLKKKVAQWRDPGLKISEVHDKKHREFLEGPDVQATIINDFQGYVLRQLQPPPPPPPPPARQDSDVLVFLSASEEDESLKRKLQEILPTFGIDVVLPVKLDSMEVEKDRKDMKAKLDYCNAVLLLYGDSPVTWVEYQVLFIRKESASRDQPLRVLAVYSEPKEGVRKPPLGISLSKLNLKIIEKPFDEFKDMLKDLFKEEV